MNHDRYYTFVAYLRLRNIYVPLLYSGRHGHRPDVSCYIIAHKPVMTLHSTVGILLAIWPPFAWTTTRRHPPATRPRVPARHQPKVRSTFATDSMPGIGRHATRTEQSRQSSHNREGPMPCARQHAPQNDPRGRLTQTSMFLVSVLTDECWRHTPPRPPRPPTPGVPPRTYSRLACCTSPRTCTCQREAPIAGERWTRNVDPVTNLGPTIGAALEKLQLGGFDHITGYSFASKT